MAQKHVPTFTRRFTQRLRARRRDLGLSQEGLASILGMSTGYIATIERGVRTPSLSTLLRLATALQTTLGALLGAGPPDPWYEEVRRVAALVPASRRRIALEALRTLACVARKQ